MLGWTLLALVLLNLATLAGAFGVLQTGWGKREIAALASGALSGEGKTAEIAGIEGFPPFDMRVDRVRLGDPQGHWLEVDGARFHLVPSALLHLKVEIAAVGAERVALNRLPPSAPTPEPPEPFTFPSLPELPKSLPVAVDVVRIFVDRLELGQPVIGQAAAFRIDGHARTNEAANRLTADLRIDRVDQATADARLGLDADLAGGALDLSLKVNETGGLLAAVSERPEAGELHLDLGGKGPLVDWRGRLALEAQHLASLETDLELGLADLPRIGIDGRLDVAPGVLPPDVEPLIGRTIDLSVRLQPTSPERVELQALRLGAAGFGLEGQGNGDLAANTVEGRVTLDVPDLAVASGLAKAPLQGRAALSLAATGALDQPVVDLTLDAGGLGYDTYRIRQLAVALQSKLRAPFETTFPGATLTGNASVAGVSQGGKPLAPEGAQGTLLTLDLAAMAPAQGPIDIQKALLQALGAQASLGGQFDPRRLAGRLRLDLDVPALRPLVAAASPGQTSRPPIDGKVDLGLDLTIGERAGKVDAVLALHTAALQGLPPGVTELLGREPRLDARASLETGKSVQISKLALQGAAIDLTGKGSMQLAGEHGLAADLDLELPRLAEASGLAGQPLSGSLAANVKASGSLSEPNVVLAAHIDRLKAGRFDFSAITLDADAAGPIDRLTGRIRLDAREARGSIALWTDYARHGQKLDIRNLSLTAPGTRLGGKADLDLTTQIANGRMNGRISDLGALAPFIGQELQGAIDLALALDAADGKQNARAEVRANRIGGSFGTLAAASVTGRATDLRGRLGLDAKIAADDFAQPGLAIKDAAVMVVGDLAALRLTAKVDGSQGATPFDLAIRLQTDVAGETKQVALQSLAGSFAKQPIKLQRTATLRMAGASYGLQDLDLSFGRARLRADATLGGGRASAKASLHPTPLAMFQSFGAPEFGGTVALNLEVSGSSAAPKIDLVVDAKGVKPRGKDLQTVPPANLALRAGVAGGRLDASAELAGVMDDPLRLQAALPLRIGLEPFAFELPRDRPIQGSLTGRTDLARIAQILVLDGQRLQGLLTIDTRLAGTLDRPLADGSIEIANGLVEDSISGVLLRDLTLRIVGDQSRINLATLSARDRRDGTLNGSGSLDLGGTSRTGLRTGLELANLQVYNAEFGKAWLSGKVNVSGQLPNLDVSSQLKVERADIRLPNPPPGKPPTLPVSVEGAPPAPPPPASSGPPLRIGLDIEVDMPEKFYVRGRGLESEWHGNLEVTGTAGDPLVVGSIDFRRGFLILLDRRFSIDQGTITFSGAKPPIPELDIKASAEASGGVTGIVQITGPATKPKLALSSDPEAPQDEVVARIMFDRSSSGISPFQGLRLAAAIQELQSGGDGLIGIGREALGIDTFDISGSGGADTTASAGKYISDNVFLEVQQGVTPGSGKATLEIELTPSISAETQIGQQGQTGASLNWTYDY
ncbi:MAG: translocation/assembly module TamB domain-containing protein [Pseudomonadota bacterium]|nr:translocation/assembly module TamB domain-containing protein [Pseudomonadota bacterium]